MDVPLILLAAGRSTRFGTLKQVAPVGPGGASLLAYTAADALLAGFSEVVLVVRPEIEAAIRAHLHAHLGTGLPLRFVHQREALGTAHAAMLALDGIGGPAAVANGDDAYGRDALRQLRRSARGLTATACTLIGYPIADTLSEHGGVSRGWVRTEGATVTAIREVVQVRTEAGRLVGRSEDGAPLSLPPDALGSMNLWMLGAGLRDLLAREFARHEPEAGEFGLSTVLGRLAQAGRLGMRLAGVAAGWFGLTFAEDLEAARDRMRTLHQSGHYGASLAERVDPFRA